MIYINSCLSTDMDLHNGEKPILCKFCDKTFSDESYLTDHMGIHRDCNPISYRYNTEEGLCQFTSWGPFNCYVMRGGWGGVKIFQKSVMQQLFSPLTERYRGWGVSNFVQKSVT